MTAGKIADVFEHAWPTTTRHIRVLEAAGLIYQNKQGRTRVYYIDRRRLELVQDWLAWFAKDPIGNTTED
jgi:DNA-binding transcriptional ArsR family regulator